MRRSMTRKPCPIIFFAAKTVEKGLKISEKRLRFYAGEEENERLCRLGDCLYREYQLLCERMIKEAQFS